MTEPSDFADSIRTAREAAETIESFREMRETIQRVKDVEKMDVEECDSLLEVFFTRDELVADGIDPDELPLGEWDEINS